MATEGNGVQTTTNSQPNEQPHSRSGGGGEGGGHRSCSGKKLSHRISNLALGYNLSRVTPSPDEYEQMTTQIDKRVSRDKCPLQTPFPDSGP